MKVLYAMAHPSDRLADERAGHVVRPRQLLAALERVGHEVLVEEAAGPPIAVRAASTYWRLRSALPAPAALTARDLARVVQNGRFSHKLSARVLEWRPDFVLETQVAFSHAGVRAVRGLRTPVVLDDVSPVEEDEETYDVKLKGLARSRRAKSLAGAALITITSNTIRAALVAEGVPADRLAVIPNGIPDTALDRGAELETLRDRLGFARDEVILGYAGSFQPFHRFDLLIRALAEPGMPERVRVLALGDGAARGGLESLANELGVGPRIVFSGRVPSDDVSSYLQVTDVGVLPATEDYTNPMKLYDYMGAGLPVIAPNQVAVTDVLPQGGSLFTPGSVSALAQAIETLVADPRRRAAGSVAAKSAALHHTWSARARQLIDEISARM